MVEGGFLIKNLINPKCPKCKGTFSLKTFLDTDIELKCQSCDHTWKIILQSREELRDRIKYENELIHNRLTWLGTLQGFLFAASAITHTVSPFLLGTAVLGIFTSLSIFIGVQRANSAIRKHIQYFDIYYSHAIIHPSDDVSGYRNNKGIWVLTPNWILPILFILFWGFIILKGFIYPGGYNLFNPIN